ncbi:MAG TPA: HDIG domain-containing protein [Dissulfurispiraceae bacterium]|nr:HDIG domain-containing protein [Dissulfurispiraceae bacterium]
MPTNAMKAATQKSQTQKAKAVRKAAELLQSLRMYRSGHSDELSKFFVLLLLSLLIAVTIWNGSSIGHLAGSFLISALILFIFYKDIRRYKPVYLRNYKMLLLLCILIAGTLLICHAFSYLLAGLHRGLELAGRGSFLFGVPVSFGAMLATLIFDFHTAIIFSFTISLLSGVWLNDPYFTIYAFIGSLTAAFSVIRCKKRSTVIKGGIYVSGVNLVTAGIILLMTGDPFSAAALPSLLFAGLSGIVVASMVSMLLPAIEYAFGITTDVSLIELLDLDQPLMKSLMISAPGTYHHSVIVGTLAEAGAEAVGVNPLLARVGAYYHDIGKIKMPEYFVENQTGPASKHEKLTPRMSSMILTSHVKEGLELGKQYKLPQTVAEIIQQHHGTSLISYFYQKALEQKKDNPPLEENYRDPGPRPQSRVAALIMMADAVEAASRTLTDPTPARIAAHVEKMINNIYLAGQIDECELTLKDISEVKKRFTFILTSIFHKRIDYPESVAKGMTHKEEKIAAQGNGSSHKEHPKTDKDRQEESREAAQEGSQVLKVEKH